MRVVDVAFCPIARIRASVYEADGWIVYPLLAFMLVLFDRSGRFVSSQLGA